MTIEMPKVATGLTAAIVRLSASRSALSARAQIDQSLDRAVIKQNFATLLSTKTCVGCKLNGADLSATDLWGADLHRAELQQANLRGAFLFVANLTQANLSGADLRGAFLPQANLTGANLSGADLSEVAFFSTNLSETNLSQAKLRGAALCNTNLHQANLRGADLCGTDLSGAVSLTSASFARAIYDQDTVFPQGFSPIAAGLVTATASGIALTGGG